MLSRYIAAAPRLPLFRVPFRGITPPDVRLKRPFKPIAETYDQIKPNWKVPYPKRRE